MPLPSFAFNCTGARGCNPLRNSNPIGDAFQAVAPDSKNGEGFEVAVIEYILHDGAEAVTAPIRVVTPALPTGLTL